MVKVYEILEGFSESMMLDFNDDDKHRIYEPDGVAIYHESESERRVLLYPDVYPEYTRVILKSHKYREITEEELEEIKREAYRKFGYGTRAKWFLLLRFFSAKNSKGGMFLCPLP